MNETLFNELLRSVEQMDEIAHDQCAPSKVSRAELSERTKTRDDSES